MPEGHTIHRLARDQRRDLVGHPIAASTVQERFATGAARLDGQVVRRVEPWGKHLFHWFASGDVLHVHLGLIGKWQRRASPPPDAVGQLRLRLEGPAATWDLSGPMVCRIVTPDDRDAVVAKLGPDPLRTDADPERLWQRLQRSSKPIGLLLMEQDVVAGIGNVYRSELLNIVGIDPRRPGRDITRDEHEELWAETVRQLKLGVRRNKIVTMRPDEIGRPISRLARGEGRYAYKQEACGRCGTPLDVFPLAGRRTWSCPTCQPR
ncbi:MAG: glycosylase [Acidimicrobiales bacterium]|nr:glycosylase [Acidimicrobiales bacterium]